MMSHLFTTRTPPRPSNFKQIPKVFVISKRSGKETTMNLDIKNFHIPDKHEKYGALKWKVILFVFVQ